MPSTRHTIIAILVMVITIFGIFSCLMRAQASVTPHIRSKFNTSPHFIGGRWQLVHAALGLELTPSTNPFPLPTNDLQTSRRVDFQRFKRVAPSPLRFTRDALHKHRISLKELVVSLRRMALEEAKVDVTQVEKKGRSRLGKIAVRKSHISTSH